MIEILMKYIPMLRIVALSSVLVFVAIAADLISGLYKAKLRNELRTSYGLKRTVFKFINYEGGIIVACCMDIILQFSGLCQAINAIHFICGVPIVSCTVAFFILFIEILSIKEKASAKTQKGIEHVASIIGAIISNKDIAKKIQCLITEESKEAIKQKKEQNGKS